MRAAVLGCGPAGLMAVHALQWGDYDIDVLSKPRKSEMFGAQYLHQPIPGMTSTAPVQVSYVLQGDAEGYRRKVYGDGHQGTVSPEELAGKHDAWDIRSTYDNLWERYGGDVIAWDAAGFDALSTVIMTYDLVVSSIPAPLLCVKGHTFAAQEVLALGDAPERGQSIPYQAPKNTVLCNGEEDVSWYRLSNIFGHRTVEWSTRVNPPLKGIARVQKPLWTNCDCWPTIKRVGRYGSWTKGVLSHQAYQDVLAAVA